jgi:hypothetical protein
MSRLLSALIGAGLAFSLAPALAQNVKSDSDKARGQEEVMQNKEQGAGTSAQGQRHRQTTDDGRSTQGSNAQGAGSDSSTAAQDQSGPQTQSGKQIPEQSAPSVGHPSEGQTTGQGKGVKKQNSDAGQSNSNSDTGHASPDSTTSGQSGGDAQTQSKKRRMQQ